MTYFLTLLVSAVVSNQVMIIYGNSTPKGLASRFSNYLIFDLSTFENLESLVNYPQPSLIIDISLDLNRFYIIDIISEFFQVPYSTLTNIGAQKISQLRFLKFTPIELEAEALIKMIKYLKWTNFNVLLSNSNENNEILSIIKSKFSEFQVRSFAYDTDCNEEKIGLIIKRFIKAEASQHILILDQSKTLKICSDSLKKLKVNKFGTYFLLKPFSIFQVDLEGALLIEQPQIQNSLTIEDFYYDSVISSISEFME